MSTFECFGLTPSFDIDLAALERVYFALQRTHHPDKAVQGDSRIASLLTSMQINECYQTLKSPLKRAQHLLKLQKLDVLAEKGGVNPSPALLEDIMEQREALASATSAAELEKIRLAAQAQQQDCISALKRLCGAEQWDEAAQVTLKLGYIERMLDECRQQSKKWLNP